MMSAKQDRLCRNGVSFSCDAEDGVRRFYGQDGAFLMLGEVKDGTANAILRLF